MFFVLLLLSSCMSKTSGLVPVYDPLMSIEVPNSMSVAERIMTISPSTSLMDAFIIGSAVNQCRVSTNLVLSIIKVESDFKINAFNPKSNDYGLMQINSVHVKREKMNIKLLLSNPFYNVKRGCKILSWFVKKYGVETGVARYNCGTRLSCVKFKSVKAYKRKVLGYKKRLDLIRL